MDHGHLLLQLKRALPWKALVEVMSRHWRRAGKNLDGRPGLAWSVSWYVPLVVLMLVKRLNPREMAAYVAEHGVARVCMGRQDVSIAQRRDHANMARAYAALGKAGLEEIKALSLPVAKDLGFADIGILSSDTTAQELPIGSPNEPGSWRGWAQRCGRAWTKLEGRGVLGVEAALKQVETILRSVKEPHLCAQGKDAKRQIWTRMLREVGQWVGQPRPLVTRYAQSHDRLTQSAMATLGSRHEVAKQLIPQMVQWITTGGGVAKNKLWPAGITQARAIVGHKAGKQVEFGLPSLLSRLGGGYVFGRLLCGAADETKMPLQALADYRAICGAQATPEVVVYDRGGGATAPLNQLAKEGASRWVSSPRASGRGALPRQSASR